MSGTATFRSTRSSQNLLPALSIGSGHSLGPEDPSLQMGAGIASVIGRKMKLSQNKIRLIAPVGAAAGLAAAFNAPISAVLFVIEEVIGTWSAGVLGAIVLAAVSSVVTMRAFLGRESLFRVPPFQLAQPWEVLAYVVLGIVGGIASLGFLKWIAYARPRLQALPTWTQYFQPAVAGLLIGLIAIKFPQVLGAGYAVIDEAMHGQFTWKLLIVLAALKILATGFSFLSGTPGGMFAPSLFIGAMLGGAVGSIEQHFFPALTGTDRHVCARRHGNVLRGLPARADHLGVHGHRAFRQLHRDSAGDDFHACRLPHLAPVSEGSALRYAFAPGRPRAPIDRRAPRASRIGRRRRDARDVAIIVEPADSVTEIARAFKRTEGTDGLPFA